MSSIGTVVRARRRSNIFAFPVTSYSHNNLDTADFALIRPEHSSAKLTLSVTRRFMQPRPSTASNTTAEQFSTSAFILSAQHGSSQHDHEPDRLSTQFEQASVSSAQRWPDTSSERGLSAEGNTPKSSRIEEYEKSAITSSARRGELLFEVVKSSRKPGDRSSVAILPNELLTHVLAHLSPVDLASTALVSRRFHELVTTPHAWRSAFARHFPGPESIETRQKQDQGQEIVRSERRAFARLTSKASWRSEYVLRTRLLRSLARGKPVQAVQSSGSNRNRVISPEVTYSTELFSPINRLHATWGQSINKQAVRLVHGAEDLGMVSSSDPATGKMDKWGRSDPQFFTQFQDRFPGSAQYGLGPGDVVGIPNILDVSQPSGMLYGEGFPGGSTYFRAAEEMRGRYLKADSVSEPSTGAPYFDYREQSTTAIWLAKSAVVPSLTDNMIGILTGHSSGIVRSFSLGANSSGRSTRYERGELTASWVLSPGVPIIAIAVDNEYSMKRMAQNRIWAIALNALGEVYTLTKFPRRASSSSKNSNDSALSISLNSWLTARTVYWNLIEPSRRQAKPDLFDQAVNGSFSYSPRSSWNGMCLSKEQITAETAEIETFMRKKPKDFDVCYGWDMRRKLVVDFAGNDEQNAGENILIIACGVDDNPAGVTRYTRVRYREGQGTTSPTTPSLTTAASPVSSSPSVFGDSRSPVLTQPTPLQLDQDFANTFEPLDGNVTPRPLAEEWRTSVLQLGGLKKVQITACAIDESTYALQTYSEDPLLNMADVSVTSSPSLGPWSPEGKADSNEIPGQRARLFAIGTDSGTVLAWNMREQIPKASEIVSNLQPSRIIFTASPEISSLAISSLYLVHGGSDGLVQVWDPLASDVQPIRTLHSRFSSRARRQLIQAQASPFGVGINMYAAGAICLDPDPTMLRGVVSLGNKLRYWAYSSSAADQYRSSKRRMRRAEHGTNQATDKFMGTARTNLKTYIANERWELEREKRQRHRDQEHLADRFGTDLLGGSEAEMMAYAAMLSQESHAAETQRRTSDATDQFDGSNDAAVWSSDVASTPATSEASPATLPVGDDAFDADLAEAIRQSLSSTPSYEIAIRPAKGKARKSSGPSSPPSDAGKFEQLDDVEFAIQLSLAEQESKKAAVSACEPEGKGKQRQRDE